MNIRSVLITFVVCFVYTVSDVEALGLLAPLKLGLPLLGLKLGVLGPLKLAAMSKGGLVLGVVGTVLGAKALLLAKGNTNSYDEEEGYYSYSGYDDSGYRKRRSTPQFEETVDSFSLIQKSDPTKCTERLLCELATKSQGSSQGLSSDELAILSVVKYKPNPNSESDAHSQFEAAIRYGLTGTECRTVYGSCPYNGEELMSLIRLFGSDFDKESKEDLQKFIEL